MTIISVTLRSWRPGLERWVDHENTTWTRRKPNWLDERRTRRFVRRSSSLVVVERSGDFDLEWLDEVAARRFWADHVAGHHDDATGTTAVPNADGIVYRSSMWTDDAGRRLVLLSEIC